MSSHRSEFRIQDMCRALDVTKGGYYMWVRRGPSARRRPEQAVLTLQVKTAFEASRQTYGCVRIGDTLRDIGIHTSARTVRRIMRSWGMVPRRARKRWGNTKSKGKPSCPDLVQRKFSADRPNLVWVSDITQTMTQEGRLYLASILDLCSRFLVGWGTGAQCNDDLVLRALATAYRQREPAVGFILHSDHGSQ